VVLADAVEAVEHALEEHPAQAVGGRCGLGRERLQPREEPVDDAVDRAQEDLLLAREVEVDRPPRDAGLAREVVDGRLLVPQAPEEASVASRMDSRVFVLVRRASGMAQKYYD
jgi:hypothetical protein